MNILDELSYRECDLSPLKRILNGKYRLTIYGKGRHGSSYNLWDKLKRHLNNLETVKKTYRTQCWEYCGFGMSYVEFHISFSIWFNCMSRKDFLDFMNIILYILNSEKVHITAKTKEDDRISITDIESKDKKRYFIFEPYTVERIDEFTSNYF